MAGRFTEGTTTTCSRDKLYDSPGSHRAALWELPGLALLSTLSGRLTRLTPAHRAIEAKGQLQLPGNLEANLYHETQFQRTNE